MKIFAKRKRNIEVKNVESSINNKDTETTKLQQQHQDGDDINKTFESDEIVKELLQQDPSTWNAKHRRLIKRYNERNSINVNPNNSSSTNEEAAIQSLSVSTIEQGNSILGTATSSIDDLTQQNTLNPNSTQLIADIEKDEDEEEDEHENDVDEDDVDDKDEDDVHDNDNDDDDDDDEDKEVKDDDDEQEEGDDHSKNQDALDTKEVTSTKDNIESNNNTTVSSATVNGDIDIELKEMLDQLNSKQRRTLVRQYDRDGNLEQLRTETIRLLDENEKTKLELEAQTKKAEEEEEKEEEIEEPVKKKARRRKPVVDESKLSPEERIRREEQRRIQAIARMNQANSNSDDQQQQHESSSNIQVKTKHRHPLNSERRRANRRKPKWESIKKSGTPNEHHTSGYYMRKVTKNEV